MNPLLAAPPFPLLNKINNPNQPNKHREGNKMSLKELSKKEEGKWIAEFISLKQ